MDHTFLWIGIIVVLALTFDFSNGVHDAANAIATTVTTRALSMGKAVAMAAVLNMIGAVVSTAVAKFIGKGLVDAHVVTLPIVAAALIGAISWNLLTWYYGLPSSSSHALIGGLVGAALFAFGPGSVHVDGLTKTVIALVTSPLAGFGAAFLLMRGLLRVVRDRPYTPTMRGFRRLQIVSAAFMAFSHGSNDAQKTMGVVTLALISGHLLPGTAAVPLWVILSSAAAMALGTAVGGWRIIKTMGSKLVDLTPAHGFAAETGGGGRDPDRHAPGPADLHHPRHRLLDFGGGRDPPGQQRALGHGDQHPAGLGADHPRRGPGGRPDRAGSAASVKWDWGTDLQTNI